MDKTKIIKSDLSNSQHTSFQICYKDTRINDDKNIQFLGLQIDKHMNWKTHIGQNSKIKQFVLFS
jgi:hypothetical protein